MYKKICYVVLLKEAIMMIIDTFFLNTKSEKVFALGTKLALAEGCFLFNTEGHHVIQVACTNEKIICPVDDISEKLIYMPIENNCFISRLPNRFGHGVSK